MSLQPAVQSPRGKCLHNTWRPSARREPGHTIKASDAPEGGGALPAWVGPVTAGRAATLAYREERLRALPMGGGDKLTCLAGDKLVSLTGGAGPAGILGGTGRGRGRGRGLS